MGLASRNLRKNGDTRIGDFKNKAPTAENNSTLHPLGIRTDSLMDMTRKGEGTLTLCYTNCDWPKKHGCLRSLSLVTIGCASVMTAEKRRPNGKLQIQKK